MSRDASSKTLWLELNQLKVMCIIGERPYERTNPQPLLIDLRLEITDAASRSDALQDTVDYVALSARVTAALIQARCQMIERAACLVRDVCLNTPGVKAVEVRVTKEGAIPNLKSASISCKGVNL